MVFGIFLVFLNFEPKSAFCKVYSLSMGYSLCKMNDFQTPLISPIFRVFCSGFLHRTNPMFLQDGFFAFLIFAPKSAFCKGYSLCMGYSLCKMADFQNPIISQVVSAFQSAFLHRTILMFLQNGFWHVFGIFIF